MAHAVFYDPRRSRWKRLRTVFDVAGMLAGIVIVVFIYTAVRSDPLPKLFLPFEKHPIHALKVSEKAKAREARKLQARRGHRHSAKAPSQVALNTDEGIRGAFYDPTDAASFSSLREYARQIDLLYPEWLHMLTPDGRLQGIDELTNKPFDVIQDGTVHLLDTKVIAFLKSEDTGTEVFPMVNNFDGTNWIDINTFLINPDARSRFLKEIDLVLASDKYRGLMVDFEDIPRKEQPALVSLLNDLSADLHGRGMKLYVSVPPQATNSTTAAWPMPLMASCS